MAGPVPQLATVPAEPSLQDVLNNERRRTGLEFNCHAVGIVQLFNPVNQTATVLIAYSQTYFRVVVPDQPAAVPGPQVTSTVYAPYPVPYPILAMAPVVFPGGGGPLGGALTFPLTIGDEVLIAFNDRDIDSWYASGAPGAFNATPRLHSLSDAIIIPGLRSLPRSLPAFDPTLVGVRDFAGTAQVGVDVVTHLARIKTAGGTLGVAQQALIAALGTFASSGASALALLVTATTPTGPLTPLNPGFVALEAAFTALGTAMAASATQFAAVIE